MKISRGKVDFQVDGLKELMAKFRAIDNAAKGETLVTSLEAAGEPMLAVIAAGVPTKTGELESHLAMETLAKDEMHATIGVGIFGDPKAPWVEYGHQIVRGGKVVGKVKPHRFIRPAWDATKATSPDLIGAALLGAVELAWDQAGN